MNTPVIGQDLDGYYFSAEEHPECARSLNFIHGIKELKKLDTQDDVYYFIMHSIRKMVLTDEEIRVLRWEGFHSMDYLPPKPR